MKDFWQKVKSFLKKFWHFVVIGVLAAAIIAMTVVMCVCMVPKGKGGGNGGGKGGQLEAPQNVQVVADRVLVWDEVLNAGGYTVKINDDETTSVTKNYLDLSAESLKTIIVSGSNTISVKANANGKYTASAYSDPITYELVLTPEEEAAAYVRLVDAIDTITADSEYSVALTVQTKIDEAAGYYQTMSLEALALENVTTAKASFDTKKEAYDTVMETAQTAYTAFLPSLTAATAEITKEESLTALSEKATAAETAYDGLSTLAKGMLTEDESTAYASLATTITAWTEEINTAKAEWEGITFTKGTDDDEAAEEVIATVNGLLKDYEDYPVYVQAGITTEIKTAAETALDDAKDQIAETVSELKATVVEISGKIESDQINDTNLEEHYEALAEIQEKELGAYAKELWDEAKAEDETALDLTKMLKDSLDYLLAIPCEEDSAMRIFVFGATGKINILYTATNIKGDPIEKTPTLSVTIEATTPSPENPVFTRLSNGIYFYECEFTQLNAADYNYTLAVAYSINGVEKQASTKYKAYMDTYFENGYKAIVNDAVTYNGAPNAEAYFDIYRDGDIEFNASNNDALPTMKALPLLAKVPVKNGMSLDAFRKQLATDYPELIGKEYEVRFVLYQDRADGDIIHLSCVKGDRISHDTYLLDLTVEDTKDRVNLTAPGMDIWDNGSLIMGAAYNPVNDQLTALGADKTDLEWVIKVTAGEKSGTFTLDFSGASISSTDMMTNLFNTLGAVGNVEITFELKLAPKADSALNDKLKISNPVTLKHTIDVSLPDNTIQLRFTSTDYFEFLRSDSGNGKVFNFGVKAVEVKVEKNGVSYSVFLVPNYDEVNGTTYNLYLCENVDGTGAKAGAGTITNGYIDLAGFNIFMNKIDGITGFDVKDGWEVSTRVLYLDGGDGGYSSSVTYGS